ncbi:MAG: DUF7305 domain-containing protein [Planctomycetota bacterium]|jgi:hypothetical protein
MNKRLKSQETGSALTLMLFAAVLLTLTGMALLNLSFQSRITAIRTAQVIQARWSADAGLEKAVVEMNNKLSAKTWSDISMPSATKEALFQSDQSFSYQVDKDGSGNYTVTSTGMAGPAIKRVYATMGFKGLFDSAILVKDRISLMPNTLIAGYNSEDAADTDFDLKLGTTSNSADRIPLGPGTVVEGDVFVGIGGDPNTVIGAGGTITGRKFTLLEEPDFPVITPPSLPNTGTALSAIGTTITLDPTGSGTYTELNLSSGVLEIQGGDVELHITGNIDMGNGCELIVRPGSSLTLYVDGNISADNSAGFNNQAGNVKDFQLFATGTEQEFNLKAMSSIFGTVYAPDVDITLYPKAEMRGAIIGKSVTFKSGGTFYYDETLRDVSIDDAGACFIVKRWRED